MGLPDRLTVQDEIAAAVPRTSGKRATRQDTFGSAPRGAKAGRDLEYELRKDLRSVA
jgi:hypothetical protein